MKRIYYNKLIRDRIPFNMRKAGAHYKIKVLTPDQLKGELLKKVGEEASALPKLKKKSDLVSELADVIDVLEEIKKVFKIKKSDIRKAQKRSDKRKGGFRKKLFLFWAEDTGYRTNEKRNK